MNIVVIGGTGRIGSKVVNKLHEHGHEAIAASPNSGVNTVTGEGLAEVLKGASVVANVSNAPDWEDNAVLKFFETSTRNLLTYEAAAGVGHHVALSVVGTERMLESGYFRGKLAQENLIKASSIPHSMCARRSFTNSSRASLIFPPTATRYACHPCSSNPWLPTMSQVPWHGCRRCAGKRHRRNCRPGTVSPRRTGPAPPDLTQRSSQNHL